MKWLISRTSYCFMLYAFNEHVDLILLGSKITADGDCSHEIKRIKIKITPWKESYDQPR